MDGKGVTTIPTTGSLVTDLSFQALTLPLVTVLSVSTTFSFLSFRLPRRAVGAERGICSFTLRRYAGKEHCRRSG